MKYRAIVKSLFNNADGTPYILTGGQLDIINKVCDDNILRLAVRAITQYGKSDTVSIGLILNLVFKRKKILIVAPYEKQSFIIMSYLIQHLFDNEWVRGMIEWEGSLERLKQERSKKRITFTNGSEVYILTADVRTISQEAKSLMGFGADIVVVDESSLLPDMMFSKILRMVGGVAKGKLIQLGNPFERNHFGRAFESDRYYKIIIRWQQALKEGRVTQEFIDEARETMSDVEFKIFYDCDFPDNQSDNSLIPYSWILKAVNNKLAVEGEKISGLDVARFGRDKSVYIKRNGGIVKDEDIKVVQKQDTMSVVGWARELLENDEVDLMNVDSVGLGAGVYDRLYELGYNVRAINAGQSPSDEERKNKFFNLRSEMFWGLRDWFVPDKEGNSKISIPNDADLIKELSEIRFGFSSDRKIKIELKEDLKKRIGRSPDKADALALAFFVGGEPIPDFYVP